MPKNTQMMVIAAVIVVALVAFFGYKQFTGGPATPPNPTAPPAAAPAPATPAPAPAPAPATPK